MLDVEDYEWGRVLYLDLQEQDDVSLDGIDEAGLARLVTFGAIIEEDGLVKVVKTLELSTKTGSNSQVITIPKACILKIDYVDRYEERYRADDYEGE